MTYGEFEFPIFFWHTENLNFPHFFDIWRFWNFPHYFDIWRIWISRIFLDIWRIWISRIFWHMEILNFPAYFWHFDIYKFIFLNFFFIFGQFSRIVWGWKISVWISRIFWKLWIFRIFDLNFSKYKIWSIRIIPHFPPIYKKCGKNQIEIFFLSKRNPGKLPKNQKSAGNLKLKIPKYKKVR